MNKDPVKRRLYVCGHCGLVLAIRIDDIYKDEDTDYPENKDCEVCKTASAFTQLFIGDLI